MDKQKYITVRRLFTRLHMHAHLDDVATRISKVLPLPLIAYGDTKLSLGFYSLVILEDVGSYHKFVKPQKGWKVIDAGAHVGIYSVEVARMVGDDGTVIAVEPDPDNFKMLRFHCALNRLRNVIPIRAALGSRLGLTKLHQYRSPHNVISDVQDVEGADSNALQVPIVTMDYLRSRCKLNDVDLLKLDVEGAEVEVVKGMQKVLPQHIVGEWHEIARLHEIKALLKEKGYAITCESSRKNLGIFYARHIK